MSLFIPDQAIPFQPDGSDLPLFRHDFHRRTEKAQADAAASGAELLVSPLFQVLEITAGKPVLLHLGASQRVQFQVLGSDRQIHIGKAADFPDFLGSELGLDRSPAAQHQDLFNRAAAKGLQSVPGDIRRGQIFRIPHQDSRDVHGHVAHTHHRHPPCGQIEPVVSMIRMPVVPRHKRSRRVATRQILSRNVQAPIRPTSDGIDNLIIMLLQFVHLQVTAHLDVAEESESGIPRGDFVGANDFLGFLVIRSHAVAHQPVGHGHALEHVHVQVEILLLE